MAHRPHATTRTATGMETGKLATWWVVASEIVIFGGLLASYLMHRLGHPEWGNYAIHTNVWFGGFNTFVLLTSSLTAVLAHYAAEQGNGKLAAKRLGYTAIGAMVTAVGRMRSSSHSKKSTRWSAWPWLRWWRCSWWNRW